MKRLVGWLRGLRGSGQSDAEPDVTTRPTPIRISKRARTALVLAVLVLFGVVVWYVPSVLTTVVGGFALALVLSFPVRWLSRFMPRGLAILLSFLLVVGLFVLAAFTLVPLVVDQFVSLVRAVPEIANAAEQFLSNALGA